MYGNDLSPVAWFVVKNELAQVEPEEVQELLDAIEAEVKPQIMPFYACDCPRGHKGKWTKKSTGEVMGDDFDPLALTSEERPDYAYEGPEVINTFWAKHGPCQATECNHRTPIMTTPVVAIKTLTVKAWQDHECPKCGKTFDIEQKEARMAPAAMLVVADTEAPYSVMDGDGNYECPHCGERFQDEKAFWEGKSVSLGKARNKKSDFTVLIHANWLKGSPGVDEDGRPLGGSVTDDADSTALWNAERAKSLKLIEVRGKLPEMIVCPDTGDECFTDNRGGTIPKEKQFTCHAATCGQAQDIVVSVQKTQTSAPVSMFLTQGHCPECDRLRQPYGGRFYATPNPVTFDAANLEWQAERNESLQPYWPTSRIPDGYMSPIQNDLPSHGMPNFADLFNPRQLLLLTRLLRRIVTVESFRWTTKEFVLGAFQQYLRNQSMLSFWHRGRDHFAPALSNCNYHPKTTSIEVGAFSSVGYGPWPSATGSLRQGAHWGRNPWDLLATAQLSQADASLAETVKTKSSKVYPQDPVLNGSTLDCCSSTDLDGCEDNSYDLVITDPPFGGLMQYSEVADFFYVWLRLVLKDKYPSMFSQEYTPKALEAVANKARHSNGSDEFYQKILTECWRGAARILKPSGIMAFTFHHSEDEPWVVLCLKACSTPDSTWKRRSPSARMRQRGMGSLDQR